MKIYVNDKGEIHSTTPNPTLTEIAVTDGTFDGWSDAKICCYKVKVDNGNVTMMTPYVDSRLIEHIDQLGKQTEAITPWTASKTAYIDDTELTFTDVPWGNTSVYVGGLNHIFFERDGDRVIVRFEPLEEMQTVTINVI